jgi:hypothetical protein
VLGERSGKGNGNGNGVTTNGRHYRGQNGSAEPCSASAAAKATA